MFELSLYTKGFVLNKPQMFYRKQALKCLRNINSVSSSTVPCKHCNKQYYCMHMIKLNVIKLTFIFMCVHIKIVLAVGESNEDAFWFLLPIMCRHRHKVIISHISAVAADIKVHLRGVNCLGSTREKNGTERLRNVTFSDFVFLDQLLLTHTYLS